MALAVGLAACGDEDALHAPPPLPVTGAQSANTPLPALCLDGTVEPCTLVLGEHGDIVSCYEGTRLCAGGVFGACTDGQRFEVLRREGAPTASSGLRPLAFSAAADCTNNPCNRYCREYEEVPAAGLVADRDAEAPPVASWLTGNANDYSPEWSALGTREPCQVAADCQLDTACSDPSLGSCSHSVCAEGEPLAPGCNRCADAVCAENPDCCATQLGCAHDPCEVGSGAPLDRQCDTCVEQVCLAHPECCDVSWDETCVGYVASECAPLGQSCECPAGVSDGGAGCVVAGEEPRDWFSARDACSAYGEGWGLMEVMNATENELGRGFVEAGNLDGAWLGGVAVGVEQWLWLSRGEVFFVGDASSGTLSPGYDYANWGPGEPEPGAVGRGITLGPDGTWRDAPVGVTQAYLCEGPKNRLGPKQSPLEWGAECVALARTECGVSCSAVAPLGIGACTPRVPSALDASCGGFDLSLGATCEREGQPQVPICNHGRAPAPAGLRVTHLPLSELGRVAPDLSGAVDCALTDAIPPGRCVTLSDCPGLVPERALLVNPPDGAQAAECNTRDNWTIYQPLGCGGPLCEASVRDARQVRNAGCAIALEHPLGVDPALARVRVGSGVPEPTCGTNEVRWGSSCYFFATDLATWDDALGRCRGRRAGWDLVALNSPAENAWVRAQTELGRDVQIGLTDSDAEGDHRWSNDSCRSFGNWAPGQPDDSPAGGEQCVRMTAGAEGRWQDRACSDGAHLYVCEGPVIDARGGCAPGQLAGPDGNCYLFEAEGREYGAARDRCAGLGAGWQLAFIDGEQTNAFVTGLIGCTPTWLGNPPGSTYSSWAPSEAVDLSTNPYMDALGLWHTTDDATPRATLCQGPATATGAPLLTQVASDAACTDEDQFYFTGNTTAPETLHLCEDTCSAAAALDGRLIELEIPCAPPAPPAVLTEHVEIYGDGSPSGSLPCIDSTPQWDFLYYDAVTPGDSRIELFVRSAETQAELDAHETAPIPIASAHAVPTDTQRCERVGGGCPIDLYGALGGAGQPQQATLLELLVRLVPGSNGEGPMLRDWTVRFSCPPSQ